MRPDLHASSFLEVPLVMLVAFGAASWLAFRSPAQRPGVARVGRTFLWVTWLAFWAVSTPLAADSLAAWAETTGPDLGPALANKNPDRAALVVLSAGIRTADPSLAPRERLDSASTQRVITAARLWVEHPVGLFLVSGTPPRQTEGMVDLATALGVPQGRIVVEGRSRNTRENAAFSAEILRSRGVETVVLVTSASHLRRAVRDFAAAGIPVIPAAADYSGPFGAEVASFLPSAGALERSQRCLHELLGYLFWG